MKLIVYAAAFVAFAAEVSLAYYSYPDEYSSFADVDWGKRSDMGWIDSDYGWGSMADADWGWKKRSEKPKPPVAMAVKANMMDDEEDNAAVPERKQRSTYSSYYYPYYNRFQRSRSLFDNGKSDAYHSMADADWGWKKRKRTSDPVVNMLTKRHLSSLSKMGRFRSRRS